jgi:hypothetical protein
MHWQDRLGAMAGVHDFQGTAVFSKLIFSPTRETWEQSHYRRAKHTIHITYLHIYTSWLYKIIQDYTRWFSQGFPKIFVVFSRFPNVFQLISLQDSELGYGLRRPSGYPIHDRRTSAPFRTEGAAAADGLVVHGNYHGNYPQPNYGHECHDISGWSNSSILLMYFVSKGLKMVGNTSQILLSCCNMWNTLKHHETPPSYCDEFQGWWFISAFLMMTN